MAYASITKRTKSQEIDVEFEEVEPDEDYVPESPVNIWFGGHEVYVSLSVAEAEELADKILEAIKQDALS